MASMAFLLLGAAVSFVASVDPLEALTQKARQLQELGALTPLTAGCASACPSMQSAYEDMECVWSKGAQEVITATVGLFCDHKSAITCATQQSACAADLLGTTPGFLTALDCYCGGCPNFGHLWSNLATASQLSIQIAQGQTTDTGPFYTAVCPMLGVVDCMSSHSMCTAYLASQEGAALTGMKTYTDACTSGGYSTQYSETYNYTAPECANEASAASGLVGLNLLFLTFSLLCLSIHEWITSECEDTTI